MIREGRPDPDAALMVDDALARFELEVVDRSGRDHDHGWLTRVVGATLVEGGRRDVTVSLLLTGDAGIAALHDRFLGDPRETDVMSFDDDDGAIDLVVNSDRAAREAASRGCDYAAELALYVVHGVLHCCGHDDHDRDARRAMRAAENRVMHALGLRHAAVDE